MAENNMLMGKSATLQDYITEFNSESIISSEFFLKQVFATNEKKMIVNFSNLIVKYMPEIKALKVKISLSAEEYQKYRFNPKRLSYDLYGTTELWFIILEANELYSALEFDNQTIVLYKTNVFDKLGRILNLENEFKNYNEEEISEALLS